MLFDLAYEAVVKGLEGGYVNHPDDRGGETYMGISRARWPSWPGWQAIDSAKGKAGFPALLESDLELQELARSFYRKHFWDPIGGNSLRYEPLAVEMFDAAVNCGPGVAVAWLQRALNILNRRGSLYEDIQEDEVFGKKTLQALDALLHAEGWRNLVLILNIMQGCHYLRLIRNDETQEAFARGWLNRVNLRWGWENGHAKKH